MQDLTNTLYLAKASILTGHALLAMFCCNPVLAGRGNWHDLLGKKTWQHILSCKYKPQILAWHDHPGDSMLKRQSCRR